MGHREHAAGCLTAGSLYTICITLFKGPVLVKKINEFSLTISERENECSFPPEDNLSTCFDSILPISSSLSPHFYLEFLFSMISSCSHLNCSEFFLPILLHLQVSMVPFSFSMLNTFK